MAEAKEHWANGIITALEVAERAARGDGELLTLLELIRTLAMVPEELFADKDPALVFALGEVAGVADRHLAKFPNRRRLLHG